MYSTVYSVLMMGLHPQKICVETDISDGLPMFQMVGYLSASVREARERVCTAIRPGGVKICHLRACESREPGLTFRWRSLCWLPWDW